ncbi:MAG: hypothetical protein KGM24_09220 [Elusimicrobia bacterium]|nr:hypothetical protein [Elusimicrobiota bacterium]
MGPGLFLAFALLGLTVARARAETPVGLGAQGVDPMAAVDNRQGLDVRDALGRPVTAGAVLRDLKRAEAARTAQNAYASALPQARRILPALDLAPGFGACVVRLLEALPRATQWVSLPPPGPKVLLLLVAVLGAVLVQGAALLPRDRPLSWRLGRCCPEVLRC